MEETPLIGYLHPSYAESLAEFGTPRELPGCMGWILERQVPGFQYHDAMGCYHRFFCQDWSRLRDDLDDLGNALVSLSLVTEPFGTYDLAYLQRCFKDVVIPFKEHFVTDLRRPINAIVSKNRRKLARKARRGLSVEKCREPIKFFEEWVALHSTLVKRHRIRGIKAFSRAAFARQLCIPGMVMFRALYQGNTVGATLWFEQGEISYGHLAAFSEIGYEIEASYALDWYAIEYFSSRIRWLDWGSSAGIANESTNGLSQYKRGWSTGTRTVYFCGRIFDHQRYAEIVKAKDLPTTSYFPAYRRGEFI